MSISYDESIFYNNNTVLKINYTGIKNGIADTDNLKMSVYAYRKDNGSPLFSADLNIENMQLLYQQLNSISIIRDSSKTESGKFLELKDGIHSALKGLSLKDLNSLVKLLSKFDAEEEVALDNIIAAQKIVAWQTQLSNLELLLELEDNGNIVLDIKKYQNLNQYVAGQPEKIFQNWIEKNLWIFGVEYIEKYDARKIAFFSEGDLLMESMDGFLDLIELKRPKYDVFQYDSNHKSYYPSRELSAALGQCLLYLQKLDEYKANLEKEYKVKVLRPRIKIVAGMTKNFNDEQYEAMRMLNSNLNHIQIISYDYLLDCGEKILATCG